MTGTFRNLLVEANKKFTSAGVPSSVLDAQILLMKATGIMSKEKLICNIDHEVASSAVTTFHALVERRIRREPVAYIIGEKEFFRRSFTVNQNCLVPRPDTETLIETALEIIDDVDVKSLLDIGTGSGIIPITLLLERKNITATAVDISAPALETAKQNAKRFDVTSMIEFIESDIYQIVEKDHSWPFSFAKQKVRFLFCSIFQSLMFLKNGDTFMYRISRLWKKIFSTTCYSSLGGRKFDLIVSNPPYIAKHARAELAPEITDHEPEIALFSGNDGLDHIKSILAGAGEHLDDQGYLILETGHDQHEQIKTILERSPDMKFIKSVKDLAELDRVIVAQKV